MTRKKSAKKEHEIAAKAEDVIPAVPLALLETNPQLPSKESVLEYFALHYADSQERALSYGTGAPRAAVAFEPAPEAGIDLETLTAEAAPSETSETLFSASLESVEDVVPVVAEDSIFGSFDFEENVQRDPSESSGLLSVSTEEESFGGDMTAVTVDSSSSEEAWSFVSDEDTELPQLSRDAEAAHASAVAAQEAAFASELEAFETEQDALESEQTAFDEEQAALDAEQAAQEAAFEAELEAFEAEKADVFEERLEAAVHAEAVAEAESEVVAALEAEPHIEITDADLPAEPEVATEEPALEAPAVEEAAEDVDALVEEASVAVEESEPEEEATTMFAAVTDEMLAEMEAKQGEKKKRSRKKRS